MSHYEVIVDAGIILIKVLDGGWTKEQHGGSRLHQRPDPAVE